MKTKISRIFIAAIFIINFSLAQPVAIMNLGNNNIIANPQQIGTQAGNNWDLQFITSGNPNMTIKYVSGFVGIGTPTPSYQLDVAGDINIGTATNCFMIGGNKILWHNNIPTNIYVGVGAGNNSTNAANVNNIIIGNNAGSSLTSGHENTFCGVNTGNLNYTGVMNTYYGYNAGAKANYSWNTFVGVEAGYNSATTNTAMENSCFGYAAGAGIGVGNDNVFIGVKSGSGLSSGDYNVGVGVTTAFTNAINNATALGKGATCGADFSLSLGSLSNAAGANSAAIGASSIALHANTIILGDNYQNVGIGFSNMAASPSRFLDILDNTSPQLRLSYAANVTTNKFTDFQTTSNGDLYINPYSASTGTQNVGIATSLPTARFDVLQNSTTASSATAGKFYTTSATPLTNVFDYIGIKSVVDVFHTNYNNPIQHFSNIGGEFYASGARSNYSVVGKALGIGKYNFGGYFCGDFASNTGNYGVWAQSAFGWAIYSNGASYSTGTWIPSDSILKDTIQPITNPFTILNQLKPRSYYYDTAAYSYMNLPYGKQYGLIAEDLERVLPDYVRHTTFPAEYDTAGTMIHDSLNFSAINYGAIDPYLISGIQQLDSIQTSRTPQNATSLSDSGNIEWGKNPLLHNTEIPMIDKGANEWNVYFTGQTAMLNNLADIGIGYPMDTQLVAKVDVLNTTFTHDDNYFTNQYAGRFITEGTFTNGPATASIDFVGVFGESNVSYTDAHNINIGGDFYGSNGADYNIGVRGTVGSNLNKTSTNYAVYGEAQDTTNYWAGMFNGYIGTTAGWIQASDAKLKQNVKPISSSSALSILSKLNPSTYTFNNTDYKALNLPVGNQYGLLAEDVKKVLPDVVRDMSVPAKYDSKGNKIADAQNFEGVNYSALIPIMIAGMKSQDSLITLLQNQLSDLQNCCTMIHTNLGSVNQGTVVLSNETIILDQNAPNPFAEETTITFSIPSTISDAKIIFYDNNGRVIKTVVINERAQSSLLVYGSDLSSGTYSYTLLADGKVIDTKKMVKQ